MTKPYELEIRWEEFAIDRSINITEASRLLHGRRRGGGVSVDVVRRWANPNKGCRPRGERGPMLVFPALKVAGEWRTMPAWTEAFERARHQLGRAGATTVPPISRSPRSRRAAHRRAEARLDAAGIGVSQAEGVPSG